jgi:lysophospholipase L1-like esterase
MVAERTAFGIALVTIGGNDLLRGLIQDTGEGIAAFADALDEFVQQLPIRPVLLGNVYDPTFGDDSRNFLGVDPAVSRKNLQRVNAVIEKVANRYGQIVDLHAHFLTGDPSWFTATIEPSLRGASEVRRAFLPYVLSK